MKVSDAVVEAAVARMAETPMQRGNFEALLADEILHGREIADLARAALEAALPMVVGEAVAWQRRYGNGRHIFANGSLWSEWHEWVDAERPQMSGQWTNEYRQVYALTNLEDAP